jgi:hypothetical protein
MKPHITADDITELQALEELMGETKTDLHNWYEHTLEVEGGNIHRALKRLSVGIAAGTIQSALDLGLEKQKESGCGITVPEIANQVCVSPAFIAAIIIVMGDKILTDDIDIWISDDDEEEGVCAP